MRVFAYGGSRYVVRNRLGEWPVDFTDTRAFEDLHALPPGGAIAYGVGICPTPVLILRQRQSENDRGGYAYTAMLDPGRSVWQRFGWNAAALLLAARADESLWTVLLREPERLATAFLGSRLEQLAPAPAPQRPVALDDSARELASALVDAALFAGPVVLSSRNAGGVQAPAVMASVLASLPPAFRCGRGWMVGGRSDNHVKFGTALVVDPSAESRPTGDALSPSIETLEWAMGPSPWRNS